MMVFNIVIAVLLMAYRLDADSNQWVDCNYPMPQVIQEGDYRVNSPGQSQPLVNWSECKDCGPCTGVVSVSPLLHCFCQTDPQCQPFGYFDGVILIDCQDPTPWLQIFMTTINGNTYAVLGHIKNVGNNVYFNQLFVFQNSVDSTILAAPPVDNNAVCDPGPGNTGSWENGLLTVRFLCDLGHNGEYHLKVEIDYSPEIKSIPSGFCLDKLERCSSDTSAAWAGLISRRNPPNLELDLRTPQLILNGVSTTAGFGERQFSSTVIGNNLLEEKIPNTAPVGSLTTHFWGWKINYFPNPCSCDPTKYPTPTYPANYLCCLFTDPILLKKCQKAKHPTFYP